MTFRARRISLRLLLAALLAVAAGARILHAHDIPADVIVQAFIKPEGRQLTLLVRVPLAAMRDMDVPLRPDGFMDLERLAPRLDEAARVWIAGALRIYANGAALPPPVITATRLSLPSDRSFTSFDTAAAHLTASDLPLETSFAFTQPLLDVRLEWPIDGADSRFSIDPAFARLGIRVLTVLRFVTPDGTERPFQFRGDPGVVALDPRWSQAAWRFVGVGFTHILDGFDHLLFLLCLVIPYRRLAPLVLIVTAFTVAHSITLVASALGAVPDRLWFPPLVETLIAASIVYMAIENILIAASGVDADPPRPARGLLRAAWSDHRLRRRWILTFGFGLIHGFGFSFALGETLQFAGAHLLTALFAFNLGVEFGQLAVLVVTVPALALVFRIAKPARAAAIILSALAAHTAWHWMTTRGATLGSYAWTLDDVWLLARVVRVLLLVVAGVTFLYLLLGRRRRAPDLGANAQVRAKDGAGALPGER